MANIDNFSKYADLIYKKIVVLLAISAGSGGYAMKFLLTEKLIFGSLLLVVFGFVAYGVFLNYMKIKVAEDRVEELLNV